MKDLKRKTHPQLASRKKVQQSGTTKYDSVEQTQIFDTNEDSKVVNTMDNLLDKSVESIEELPPVKTKLKRLRTIRRDAINQKHLSSGLAALRDMIGNEGQVPESKSMQTYSELEARYSYSLDK